MVPSFVIFSTSSLTSLGAIKPQAQANAFPCQRKNSFPAPCGAGFHPTSLEARVTGWTVFFAVRLRLR